MNPSPRATWPAPRPSIPRKLSYEWFSIISTTTCSICGSVSVAAEMAGLGRASGRRMRDRPRTRSAATCDAAGSVRSAPRAQVRRDVRRPPASEPAASTPAPSIRNDRRVLPRRASVTGSVVLRGSVGRNRGRLHARPRAITTRSARSHQLVNRASSDGMLEFRPIAGNGSLAATLNQAVRGRSRRPYPRTRARGANRSRLGPSLAAIV